MDLNKKCTSEQANKLIENIIDLNKSAYCFRYTFKTARKEKLKKGDIITYKDEPYEVLDYKPDLSTDEEIYICHLKKLLN